MKPSVTPASGGTTVSRSTTVWPGACRGRAARPSRSRGVRMVRRSATSTMASRAGRVRGPTKWARARLRPTVPYPTPRRRPASGDNPVRWPGPGPPAGGFAAANSGGEREGDSHTAGRAEAPTELERAGSQPRRSSARPVTVRAANCDGTRSGIWSPPSPLNRQFREVERIDGPRKLTSCCTPSAVSTACGARSQYRRS